MTMKNIQITWNQSPRFQFWVWIYLSSNRWWFYFLSLLRKTNDPTTYLSFVKCKVSPWSGLQWTRWADNYCCLTEFTACIPFPITLLLYIFIHTKRQWDYVIKNIVLRFSDQFIHTLTIQEYCGVNLSIMLNVTNSHGNMFFKTRLS